MIRHAIGPFDARRTTPSAPKLAVEISFSLGPFLVRCWINVARCLAAIGLADIVSSHNFLGYAAHRHHNWLVAAAHAKCCEELRAVHRAGCI